ncbi:PREDICTED: uncharacterized protein LOC106811124 [Priapulus caudatus]|uniref:Uncharacterized protein LOC106811124 n=1 Tax=Priapulus caudatus TaxID=37621 RepID=A0ABM1ED78_PRICU|nr:PREDICTED: uncharacterized protein LOC106811124 [Priapulus caudatus]
MRVCGAEPDVQRKILVVFHPHVGTKRHSVAWRADDNNNLRKHPATDAGNHHHHHHHQQQQHASRFRGQRNKMEPPRILHWAVPRSLSTALLRSIMTSDDIEVKFEPFVSPYYFGEERISRRYDEDEEVVGDPSKKQSTFVGVKNFLEGEMNETSKAVFVKDMAYAVVQRGDYDELLPEGYVHTFQIRHPARAIASMHKASTDIAHTGWDHFDESEVGYKELSMLFDHVTKELGQEAIVIDSEDLVRNPESILQQYCKLTGLTYVDTMLDWSDCPVDESVFGAWLPWVTGVLKSTRFHPPSGRKDFDVASLPEPIQACIEDCMPYYNNLHAKRIRP